MAEGASFSAIRRFGVVRKRRAGGREECDGGDRQLGYALQSDHCTLTG